MSDTAASLVLVVATIAAHMGHDELCSAADDLDRLDGPRHDHLFAGMARALRDYAGGGDDA